MSKEAMNHAIDVLRDSQDYKMGRAMTVEAVEFLEEALAKQEQRSDNEHLGEPVALETVYETIIHWDEGGGKRSRRELARRIEALYTTPQPKQEHCEPCGHGGRPMTLRECMEAEEPQQWRGFTYAQIKEHAEGIQRDYDLLLAEYNLLKQEQRSVSEQLGEPVAWCRYEDGMWVYYETKAWDDLQPLYTTPPQRKPLTDEIDRLRKALVYVAHELYATPRYMLAEGIALLDGDAVRVSIDGWVVEASNKNIEAAHGIKE